MLNEEEQAKIVAIIRGATERSVAELSTELSGDPDFSTEKITEGVIKYIRIQIVEIVASLNSEMPS